MGKRVQGLYLSAMVSPGNDVEERAGDGPPFSADAVRRVAGRMLPFYRAIARGGHYAGRWSEAVVEAKLNRMERLLVSAAPKLGRHSLGTNGIGYEVTFSFPALKQEYANGTTIPPGLVQFRFEPRAHAAVAASVLPLYRALAADRRFAARLARAVRADDSEAVAHLARSKVRSAGLKSVTLDETGVGLTFRFPFSDYPYRNLLYLERPEGE